MEENTNGEAIRINALLYCYTISSIVIQASAYSHEVHNRYQIKRFLFVFGFCRRQNF